MNALSGKMLSDESSTLKLASTREINCDSNHKARRIYLITVRRALREGIFIEA
jgi:hypothetical protein